MKIPNFNTLPEAAQAAEWARTLHSYPSTLTRAYQSGKLKGSKIGRRTVLFTRSDILSWLGLEVFAEPVPVVPAPAPLQRITAKQHAGK